MQQLDELVCLQYRTRIVQRKSIVFSGNDRDVFSVSIELYQAAALRAVTVLPAEGQ